MPLRKFVLTIWTAVYDFDRPPDPPSLLHALAEEIDENRAELVLITRVASREPEKDPDYNPSVGANLSFWLKRVWN